MFVENGYNRSKLSKIVADYGSDNSTHEQVDDGTEKKPVISLPWIPKIGPKLRSIYLRHGIKVVYHCGPTLKDILSRHKCRLPPNSNAGVYNRLQCRCSKLYIGETRKRILTRAKEHERDAFEGRWAMSGAAEHAKSCSHSFESNETKTVAKEENMTRRKIRESLEIRRHKRLHNEKVLNRDSGTLVSTTQWDYLLGNCDFNY